MKTISQRLQSRISLRRNYIAYLEDTADYYKTVAEGQLAFQTGEIRKRIKPLAGDQKLDKDLFRLLVSFGLTS